MTRMETKVVLEDGVPIGGKQLREVYEVVNHKRAYRYVKTCIAEEKVLDEHIVKDIHAILTENIMVGGVYRNQVVRISGAGHTPLAGNDMYVQIKNFYADLTWKKEGMDLIAYAAWTHAEFVRIHPFIATIYRTDCRIRRKAAGYLYKADSLEIHSKALYALKEMKKVVC